MKIGIYPGCSSKEGSKEYLESIYALAKDFEIEVTEIAESSCCCTNADIDLNDEKTLSVLTQILAQTEKEGFDEIIVLCIECFNRLSTAQNILSKNSELKSKVLSIINMPYTGNVKLTTSIQFIEKHIIDLLQYKQDRTLEYKVACYYGCSLYKPCTINPEHLENPQSMENILKIIGATPIEWNFKTQCCDGGFSKSEKDIIEQSGKMLEDAVSRGAEVVVVVCPKCHYNLDKLRPKINRFLGKDIQIPVIYITQAIGIAAGIDNKRLGFHRHHVPVDLPYQSDIEHLIRVKPKE